MAISTEIVGKTFGPFVRDYTFKDLEICALGCGAGWDGRVDLEYVNEHDAKSPDLKVLPIFAVPLAKFAVSFAPQKGDFIGRKPLEQQFAAFKRIMNRDFSDLSVLPRRIQPITLLDRGVMRRRYARLPW